MILNGWVKVTSNTAGYLDLLLDVLLRSLMFALAFVATWDELIGKCLHPVTLPRHLGPFAYSILTPDTEFKWPLKTTLIVWAFVWITFSESLVSVLFPSSPFVSIHEL